MERSSRGFSELLNYFTFDNVNMENAIQFNGRTELQNILHNTLYFRNVEEKRMES